jgi:hypothetical protein
MLVKVQGSKLDGMTPSERGAINKALRDIKETAPPSTTSEQMAAEIKKRAGAYSEKFSEGTIFTATALAKYWSQLGEWRPAGAALVSPQKAPVTPCPIGDWRLFAREVIGWSAHFDDSIKWEDLSAEIRKEWLRHFEFFWRRAWTTLFDFAPPASWWGVLDMHKPQLLEQIFKREGDGAGTAA